MDLARMIQDGTFSIVQDSKTKEVKVKYFEDAVYEETPGRVLSFDELSQILIRERTKYFMRTEG